ncbi:MAG: threonine--tRNA ligase [Candidatus Lambdaproteobacteria bacterium]|nr:threonine--tRNA ligase [Candidatus Lambdaproteobacteria bacterium]
MKNADQESLLYRIRHSLAHVLAQAVLELRPNAKLGYGPPTENGFFYDFDLDPPLSTDDLPELEKRMRRIIKGNQPFQREDFPADALIQRMRADGWQYKVEMAEEFKAQGENQLSVYRSGDFLDMCEGPHVATTGELPADGFALDTLAGAYWKGNEANKMMQRIYGLAFLDKQGLRAFRERRELARQRDHRKLGAEMALFTISEEVGKGLPLFMPRGEAIRGELEKLAVETEFRAGYQRVSTPHITREGLYHTSGHLPYYAADMFPPMQGEDGAFYLKPMNCPHHHMIYKALPRSYRELPLRLSEYGMCYRYEQSGELSGLLRVRALCINDAHIYCTPEQSKQEFIDVMNMHAKYYALFGITDYWVRLSLPDLENSDKYVDNPAQWQQAERIISEAMQELDFPFESVRGEAAFYGPKIDMQIKNVIGREETASTNQLDLIMAERFDLTYVGADNQRHRPHIIHRAPLGSHERFIAFLVEHYGGVFPTWLAPEQVRLIPVAPAFVDYAQRLQAALREDLVRATVDDSSESFGKKIRNGATQKVPNLFIVGEKEQSDGAVSWRRHGDKAQQTLGFAAARDLLRQEIAGRVDWRVKAS